MSFFQKGLSSVQKKRENLFFLEDGFNFKNKKKYLLP
uniref:Uncharacterized protein n=1 Tax=viral metagenome TaxID=1070528 RepID=A0A6C0IHN6_9ZZZZ